MKKLKTYIHESLDSENLFWKLDKWFERNTDERDTFIDIVNKCKKAGIVDQKTLEKYVKDADLNINEFVDFAYDTVEPTNELTDYMYMYKKIIETVLANKSKNNEYINREK